MSKITDWENTYEETNVESMPWYIPHLDHDFEQAIIDLRIQSSSVLDLGTGPGTQAIAMAKKGFSVTATDISHTAIEKAKETTALSINFLQDDIVNTKITKKFDVILDRGCFHVFSAEQRNQVAKNIINLLIPKGYYLNKCFSYKEEYKEGPYRFTPEEIKGYFNELKLISCKESIFHGNLDFNPKAIFTVFQK